jgi:hypothetical protein
VNWFRIRHIGEQDKPIPTIWISTEPLTFRAQNFDQTVVLTPLAYEAVSRVSHDFANSRSEFAEGSTDFGSLEVVEAANGDESLLFTVDQHGSCGFLTQLVHIEYPVDLAEPIRLVANLGRRLGCSDTVFDRP